jgi:hypothetical protein
MITMRRIRPPAGRLESVIFQTLVPSCFPRFWVDEFVGWAGLLGAGAPEHGLGDREVRLGLIVFDEHFSLHGIGG